MIFNFSSNKYKRYEKRAEEDFSKIKNNYCQEKNFAIICIDVQENFLKKIYPIEKREILIRYINKLIDLCDKNNILFFDIKLGDEYTQVLKNKKNIYVKDFDGVLDDDILKPQILKKLEKNKIEVLYMLGINRSACVLKTIFNFLKEERYKIITSFLGTGTYKQTYDIYNYKNKNNLSSIYKAYQRIYEDNKYEGITLSNDIKLLLRNGVVILDYYGENKD